MSFFIEQLYQGSRECRLKRAAPPAKPWLVTYCPQQCAAVLSLPLDKTYGSCRKKRHPHALNSPAGAPCFI